jgi:hypothetical protein
MGHEIPDEIRILSVVRLSHNFLCDRSLCAACSLEGQNGGSADIL